jgi:hypothetical protein
MRLVDLFVRGILYAVYYNMSFEMYVMLVGRVRALRQSHIRNVKTLIRKIGMKQGNHVEGHILWIKMVE